MAVQNAKKGGNNVKTQAQAQQVQPQAQTQAQPQAQTQVQPQQVNNAGKKQTKNAKNESGTPTHRNYISEALAGEVLTLLKEKHDNPPNVATVQAVLETFITMIVDRTIAGESTTITNFATFHRKYVKFRMHNNPKTRDPAPKSEHYKMHVESKPALKDKLEAIPISQKDKNAA